MVFTGVDVVPEAGRLWPLSPTHGDTALSMAGGISLVLGGEVGVLLGDVLVESEAAAKPWTSSLVLGVSRVIALLGSIESG